jgi:hypothetical protein
MYIPRDSGRRRQLLYITHIARADWGTATRRAIIVISREEDIEIVLAF